MTLHAIQRTISVLFMSTLAVVAMVRHLSADEYEPVCTEWPPYNCHWGDGADCDMRYTECADYCDMGGGGLGTFNCDLIGGSCHCAS